MRLIVFKQQMEKHAWTSHYVVTGNSLGQKKEKPAIAEPVMNSEKLLSTVLPSMNQTMSSEFLWSPYSSCPLFIGGTPYSTSVTPFTTTCVQAAGSLTVVEKVVAERQSQLWSHQLQLQRQCASSTTRNKAKGASAFCPRYSIPWKLCPHEGSQPGLVFCS